MSKVGNASISQGTNKQPRLTAPQAALIDAMQGLITIRRAAVAAAERGSDCTLLNRAEGQCAGSDRRWWISMPTAFGQATALDMALRGSSLRFALWGSAR